MSNHRPVRVCIFGTFDDRRHPRVSVLEQGLIDRGVEVVRCNVPWDAPTAARIAALRDPLTAVRLGLRLLGTWARLLRRSRRVGPVDAVLVGYLGILDVHLARWCWPRAIVVLDHLAPAGGTVTDRAGSRAAAWLAKSLDRCAVGRADTVLVDTDEHRRSITGTRVLVVPVGAPRTWFHRPKGSLSDGSLRIVFFGLHTPLQGTPVIGRAVRVALEAGADLQVTMIGGGQDLAACRHELRAYADVTWIDWVPSDELSTLVSEQDVCLGIFGSTAKAWRVVPNKVFQGAAAGCVVVTSDTPPQRRLVGEVAVMVAPGDAEALAAVLIGLAADRSRLISLQEATYDLAQRRFRPSAVVGELVTHLERTRADG